MCSVLSAFGVVDPRTSSRVHHYKKEADHLAVNIYGIRLFFSMIPNKIQQKQYLIYLFCHALAMK